ncbi:transposase [bacterium]|nr:MAG: transposase [bacterium]
MFRWALLYHHRDVPKLGTYGAFCGSLPPVSTQLTRLLGMLLVPAKIQFIDSTKLPVCSNHRTGRYRVAEKLAGVGRNWQGYWYGFKLHLAINGSGQISALAFTPADVYDGHITEQLVRAETKIVVGDSHYGDRIQRAKLKARELWSWLRLTGASVARLWQDVAAVLLYKRAKIEATFDPLKEHLPLVSSFPRSVNGCLLHYVRYYWVTRWSGF